jgi:hypothetical protein
VGFLSRSRRSLSSESASRPVKKSGRGNHPVEPFEATIRLHPESESAYSLLYDEYKYGK